ncbi:MAG: bifunctional hydroxymethylpyrimidine kinase/phosphomethylpyrimidine kinase [Clostridiales bacterium]|nr:bifunctional hydroxymethylpyrimidine kinase/phosphomethylpyrimidine kinase [Candidatus Crickella merdequi]
MNDSILLVNDVCGYGRVSTFAMLPVLTRYGLHPYILPTALVSNTLDYGLSETLDTTEFMRNAIDKWDKLGFSFGYISTGFICNENQVSIILELIDRQDSPFVFVDPIMADSGELYPDMYPGAIECNRQLAARANVLLPNFTEAKLLTDLYKGRDILSEEEYLVLARALMDFGPECVIIKGCKDDKGCTFNLVYNGKDDSLVKLPFERIDADYIGTGDIFSAVLISEYVSGASIEDAVNKAADFVREVIMDNLNNEDHFDLRFEQTLSKLD